MKKVVQFKGNAFFLKENFGNGIGLYQGNNKKIIAKNGMHQKILLKPSVTSENINSDFIDGVIKVSDWLLEISIGTSSGYIYYRGEHTLKPEPQPELYATNRYPEHTAVCYSFNRK